MGWLRDLTKNLIHLKFTWNENWNLILGLTMWLQKKTKICICILFLYVICVLGFWGWLDCWPVIARLPDAQGLWDAMSCWCYLILIFLKPNHGNAMACSMMCVVYWLLLLSSLPMWSWGVCIWDTWLNHFWVIDQLYLD